MRDLIIEYISYHLSLKGSMVVCFDGRKIYHETLIEHISKAFHINKFVVDGYLSYCIFELDDDFSYTHWSLITEPSNFLEAGYVYAPYIPVIEAPTIVEGDFIPRIALNGRYANRIINNRFYGHIVLTDMEPIIDLPIP